MRSWGLSNGYTDLPAGNGSYASKGPNHPVHNISWYDVVKWCNACSEKEGLTPCYSSGGAIYRTGTDSNVACNWSADGYRLPTEAEWEKAARGGVSGKNFPWGDSDTINHSNANYYANSSRYNYDTSGYTVDTYHPSYYFGTFPFSAPVGSFAPNGYGLYDMSGNMEEWCWDWYQSNYYLTSPSSNPTGPVAGTGRIVRGGWYGRWANMCRVSDRYSNAPSYNSFPSMSFRLARNSTP